MKNAYILGFSFKLGETMHLQKKTLMLYGLAFGVMLFFIGMAANIALGPSTEEYLLPHQVSSLIKLTGMAFITISMIIGGFFVEHIDKDTKTLLVIFGVIILLLNIFLISSTTYY